MFIYCRYIRDDIKSSGKFAICSSFKIGGREGVQWRWLFKIAETLWNPVLFNVKWSRKCLKVQRDVKTIFPGTFCIHRVRGVCPCLPSNLTEYPVYLGVVKPPTLSDNIHDIHHKSYALCQSLTYIGNKQVLPTYTHCIMCYLINWGGEIRCLR